jgi:hypothetical protein
LDRWWAGKKEGTCKKHVPKEKASSSIYEWAVAVVGEVVSSGVGGSGSGVELGLRVRPRNGCRPKSASFSDRMP